MILAASNGLPGLDRVAAWFDDSANWWGPSGLLARLDEHVVYSLVLVVAAVVVALPLGLVIGHTGRGVAALAGIANGLRAIPSLGLLLFLIVLLSPRVHVTSGFTSLIARGSVPYLIPAMIVLVVVAVPPILTSTYAGVRTPGLCTGRTSALRPAREHRLRCPRVARTSAGRSRTRTAPAERACPP